jgi:hypothetical protein
MQRVLTALIPLVISAASALAEGTPKNQANEWSYGPYDKLHQTRPVILVSPSAQTSGIQRSTIIIYRRTQPEPADSGQTNAVERGVELGPGKTNAPAAALILPQEIEEIYKDWNFAACFSTPTERSRVHFVADLNHAKALSPRLKAVGEVLHQIEHKIQKINPDMAIGSGKIPLVPAELLEPVEVKTDGATVSVRVEVWPLSPQDNAQLVLSYDKIPKQTPLADLQRLESSWMMVPRTEIHKWTLVNGRWIRNEANVVLVK